MKPEKIVALLTDEEKEALAVLHEGGFIAMTECKIEDGRELDTGRRQPTWRHQGRYDLVMCIKDLAGRNRAQQDPDPDNTPQADGDPNAPTDPATHSEADTETDPGADPAPELPDVDQMKKADLLAEAKTYEEITGEHDMKVADLRSAVQQARERRKSSDEGE